jgi:hypothetical protein
MSAWRACSTQLFNPLCTVAGKIFCRVTLAKAIVAHTLAGLADQSTDLRTDRLENRDQT